MQSIIVHLFRRWEKISQAGLSDSMTHDEREWHILANRLLAIVAFYFSFIYPLTMILALCLLILYGEPRDKILVLVYHFTPVVAFSSVVASLNHFIWKRIRQHVSQHTKHNLAYMMLNLVALTYLTNAFLYPREAPYALQGVALLPVFFMLRPIQRITGIQVASLILLCLITAATVWQQFFRSPLVTIPSYLLSWASPLIYFLAYTTIGLIAFYLRHESTKSKLALNLEREKNAKLHQQSEKLLLNILPAEVSDELKEFGQTTPREYSSTTVLFTDFVGFTRIAERLTAVDLVHELDHCFSYFDNVMQKYGLEKLKTIGDAYMAAGGIPSENKTHPIDCALAALEIQAFMNQMKEIKEQQGLPYWELRLGMHTGSLVAGVVGEKKFAYDVWGDTVNTASRMESSGEPGAINISSELYNLLQFLFACEYRGKIYAKNKGEIEMYFLRGIKPKYSINGQGRVPNDTFQLIYKKIKTGAKLVRKSSPSNSETT